MRSCWRNPTGSTGTCTSCNCSFNERRDHGCNTVGPSAAGTTEARYADVGMADRRLTVGDERGRGAAGIGAALFPLVGARTSSLAGVPDELDPRSRAALEMALAVAGFVFEVTRVLEIDEEVEIRRWRVETQQGPRTFQTRLDDWPRTLPHGGLLIRDLAGDLYHLGRPAALDRHSRELLWAFVD